MGEFALSFVVNHREYFMGVASGYAVAHIPQAVCFAFHYAMKVPWFRAAILANPAQAKSIIRAIEQELEKDIDAEVATTVTTTTVVVPEKTTTTEKVETVVKPAEQHPGQSNPGQA